MKALSVSILVMLCLWNMSGSEEKTYHKSYYDSGQIKAEGWLLANFKTNYWFFYNENGSIKSKGEFKDNEKHGYWYVYDTFGNLKNEGHYSYGKKENWWISYGDNLKVESQYKENMKNGYCLWYKKGKLFMAERFNNNAKEGEWTSIWAFKRDNPNAKF